MNPVVAAFLKSLWHIWGYNRERGAPDIHAQSCDGHTPLHFAVRYNNMEAAVALLQEGADPSPADGDRYTPLHWAIAKGNAEMARLLVEQGASLEERNVDGKTPEEYAMMHKNTQLAEMLRNAALGRKCTQDRLHFE